MSEEAHTKVWEGPGGPPKGRGGGGWPIQRSGRRQESHLEVMEGS